MTNSAVIATSRYFISVILLRSSGDASQYTGCAVGAYAKTDTLPKSSAAAPKATRRYNCYNFFGRGWTV